MILRWWQVAGGRWQVAGGRWQVAGGRWQVAGGRSQELLVGTEESEKLEGSRFDFRDSEPATRVLNPWSLPRSSRLESDRLPSAYSEKFKFSDRSHDLYENKGQI
jgi:hypothetical protein